MLRLLSFICWTVLLNRALEKLDEAETLRLVELLTESEEEREKD